MKKEERDFYLWLHNTLKIKQNKAKVRSRVNSKVTDIIAEKIAKVEEEIAKSMLKFDIADNGESNTLDCGAAESKTSNYEAAENSTSDYGTEEYKTSDYVAAEYEIDLSVDIPTKLNYPSQQLSNDSQDDMLKTFAKMRKIAKGEPNVFHFDDFYTYQFCEQAKYMKDFEDNYNHPVEFDAFRPIYAYMNNQQLRTYFTWRTKLKNGIVVNTSWSYVQIFVFEIINLIHDLTLEECVDLLIKLWSTYRKFNGKVDRYFASCIKDFYICNDFECEYSDIEDKFPIKVTNQDGVKEAILNRQYDGLFDYVNNMSSYKATNSIFFESPMGYLLKDSLSTVLQDLDYFFSEQQLDFTQILVGKPIENSWWLPFRNAVYHKTENNRKRTVTISRTEKYVYNQGRWKHITYDGGAKYRKLIGFILKAMESKLREITCFKYKLKPNIDGAVVDYYTEKKLVAAIRNEDFIHTINKSIEIYVAKNEIELVKIDSSKLASEEAKNEILVKKVLEIKIDPTKFGKIRDSANSIQEKLVIDENQLEGNEIVNNMEQKIEKTKSIENIKIEPLVMDGVSLDKDGAKVLDLTKQEDNTPFIAANMNLSEWDKLIQSFSSAEIKIVEYLINGKSTFVELNKVASSYNSMVEVLIETINEKAIEIIGDNIIEASSEIPFIYEDYINDVTDVFRKEKC